MASSINNPTISTTRNIKYEDEVESATTSNSSTTGFVVVQQPEKGGVTDDHKKVVSFNTEECISTIELNEDDDTPCSSDIMVTTYGDDGQDKHTATTSATTTSSSTSFSTYKEDNRDKEQEKPAANDPSPFKAASNTFHIGLAQGNTLFHHPSQQSSGDNRDGRGNSARGVGGSNAKPSSSSSRVSAAFSGGGGQISNNSNKKNDPLFSCVQGGSISPLADGGTSSFSTGAASATNRNNSGGGTSFIIHAADTPYSFSTLGGGRTSSQQDKKTTSSSSSSSSSAATGQQQTFTNAFANDVGTHNDTTAGSSGANVNNINQQANDAAADNEEDDCKEVYLKLHYYSKGPHGRSRPVATTSSSSAYGDAIPPLGGIGGLSTMGGGGGILFGTTTDGNTSSTKTNAGLSSSLSGSPGPTSGVLYCSTRLTPSYGKFVRYGDTDDHCLPHYIINDGLGEICTDCGKTNFTNKGQDVASSSATIPTGGASSSGTSAAATSSKKAKKSPQEAGTNATTCRYGKKRTTTTSSNDEAYCDKISLMISGFMERWVYPPLLLAFFFILVEYLLGFVSDAVSVSSM